jgi:NAD(P)H-quinone oxidoreductase subunit 4
MAIVGTGLTAVYFVILLNRTCFGRLDNRTAYYPKVLGIEQIPALVLTALILWFGLQPANLVKWSEATAQTYSRFTLAELMPVPIDSAQIAIKK